MVIIMDNEERDQLESPTRTPEPSAHSQESPTRTPEPVSCPPEPQAHTPEPSAYPSDPPDPPRGFPRDMAREVTRTLVWCAVSTSLLTALILIVVLRSLGLLHFGRAVEFGGGGRIAASVQKLQQVWNSLSGDFYEPVDEDKMIEYAAAGMAQSVGDVYTTYYTKEEMQKFTEHSAGSFFGIGVYVTPGENGRLRVTDVFEGSPADEAGVLRDDEIVSVDGLDVGEIADENRVIDLIKGESGAKVRIGFFRPAEARTLELEIERREIKTENILSKTVEAEGGPFGYIRLVMFDNSASEYFNRQLDQLLEQDIRGLVIDVRGNPGGSYDETVKIADRLVGEGVIVYTEDRAGRREYRRSDAQKLDLPIRVLVNGDSASASEILAGALKDHGAARLVGTKTFGKGLVQAVQKLRDGAGLKYTRSRYFTPSGLSIQGTGIEPDLLIESPSSYAASELSGVPAADDAQLLAALADFGG
ncbi:MAG: PDZ domain-containing protein [Clostridiales bacterium]|nr:PDZ domain-containing protein [Clostridiales bacterium]